MGVGGSLSCGRFASLTPPLIHTAQVDAELPCVLHDVVDPRLDPHRAPTRSHSMPDLGTLGIVWEFPESHFGGFDAMLEDGAWPRLGHGVR